MRNAKKNQFKPKSGGDVMGMNSPAKNKKPARDRTDSELGKTKDSKIGRSVRSGAQ